MAWTDDSSSNSNNLSTSGSPALTTGQFDTGVDLEDTNPDYLYCTDDTSLDLSGSFTLECWAKPENLSVAHNHTIISKGDNASTRDNYSLQYLRDNGVGGTLTGKLAFSYYTSGWHILRTDAQAMTPGTMYHVAVVGTYGTGANFKIFVNGTEAASSWILGDGSASATTNNDNFNIGCYGGDTSRCFDGILDECRISDIRRYTSNFTPSSSAFEDDGNTMALYHFDEPSGGFMTTNTKYWGA